MLPCVGGNRKCVCKLYVVDARFLTAFWSLICSTFVPTGQISNLFGVALVAIFVSLL